MGDWEQLSALDLQNAGILRVEDGNHGEYRPRRHEFTDHGTFFIRATDIDQGAIRFDSASAITEEALQRIRKGVGQPGDILFSHKGTVGKVALVQDDAPPFVCSPQTTFWRSLDPDLLDRRYLHAYLRSPGFIRQWWVRKGETDMADYVSLTAQRQLVVPIPPIAVQRSIGAAVGAFDDLIANNTRRIAILEDIARAIYREWFIEYHYPGHEVGEAGGEEPPVLGGQQHHRSVARHRRPGRTTRRVLAYAGFGQVGVDGVLHPEGAAQSSWQLDVLGGDGSCGS